MKKNNNSKLLDYKDVVIENLRVLMSQLDNSEVMGVIDIEEMTHNEIVDLIEETKAIDSLNDLSEIISRAKTIENNIDRWYSKEGLTNIELTWPEI